MSLLPGTRLGPYEVAALIGIGGMGEVYRARDLTLNRDVAIKTLPSLFATDPERLARFSREAQVLAALNHPNIAQIYGIETAGTAPALVMEFVDGPTLADMIAARRDPRSESAHLGHSRDVEPFAIARQIAEALEAAHDQGIVHRDLKPQNIKVRADGRVKVLDFGLAKTPELGGPLGSQQDLLNSPTITSPAAITSGGVVLGTAAYMSPEQARGRATDRRADIWAFGAVLYELLTGRQAFAGDTVSDTIAAVLTRDPDLELLPVDTPVGVRRVLARCLQKDPGRRFHHMADVRLELEEPEASPAPAAPPPGRGRRPLVFAGLGAVAGAGLGALVVWGALLRTGDQDRRYSFTIPGAGFSTVSYSALSPDGRWIAYAPNVHAAPFRLFVRALDGFDAREVMASYTTTGFSPFFSADSQWLAYFLDSALYRVPVAGGTPERLASLLPGPGEGAWADDGTIVISANARIENVVRRPLARVTAGGAVEPITAPGASESHHDPEVLPGSTIVLFTVVTPQSASIVAMPLAGGARRLVLRDARRPRYTADGHLLFQRVSSGELMGVRFHLSGLEVEGEPVHIAAAASVVDSAAFAASLDGTLIYSEPGDTTAQSGFTAVAVDRAGAETVLVDEPRSWAEPRLSPDGRMLLVRDVISPDCVLWTIDLARGSRTRVTFEGDSHNPIWRSDGWVSWGGQSAGTRGIRMARPDTPGSVVALAPADHDRVPESWSPDGRRLAFTETHPTTGQDIWVLDDTAGTARPFAASGFNEHTARFSRDGRWLSYVSNASGRDEVYIQQVDGDGARQQVSVDGGVSPLWAPEDRELFYVERAQLMAVDVDLRAARVTLGRPRLVLQGPYVLERVGNFDITPDGRRFVVVRRSADSDPPATLRVLVNWSRR